MNRDFARTEPNRLWLTDITEHPTREGKVYCAVVLDAFYRTMPPSRPPMSRTAVGNEFGRHARLALLFVSERLDH